MKKILFIILSIIIIITAVILGIFAFKNKENKTDSTNNIIAEEVQNEVKNEEQTEEQNNEEVETEEPVKNNFVSYNGNLKLDGTNIVNQYNEKIQLRGMSSHGVQWYNNFVNDGTIKILKDEWNSNVFRIAMYTEENGYINNKKEIMDTVLNDIEMIIKNDLYVIVDWHILSDGNPNTHINEAKEFFNDISTKYKNTPNIIYEICNEPNGNVSWSKDIKPYAEEIINIIRKNSDNIIIVGTGTWCQDVLDPINDRIKEDNIIYSAHFYSGTHTQWLRDRVKQAIEKGLPIFVSEWGTSDASGNGGVFLEEAQKWVDFMKENNISWANWSLCDKNETSALLKNGTNSENFTDKDLTESGQFVKKAIIGK